MGKVSLWGASVEKAFPPEDFDLFVPVVQPARGCIAA